MEAEKSNKKDIKANLDLENCLVSMETNSHYQTPNVSFYISAG